MDGVLKILLLKAVFVLCFNQGFQNLFPFNKSLSEYSQVPVMELRFFMMGRDSADVNTILKIKENVNFLNEEFEGAVKFEAKEIFVDEGYALLPDLHKEYFGMEKKLVDSLVGDLENSGSINVFIFDSYVVEEVNAELMGFTPIFKASHKEYINVSPSFDRIFIAYSALSKQTTLVHEMGHFLGLDHPWEMTEISKNLMGLNNESEVDNNHMAYGINVESFTYEQLDRMQHFALEFRSYLINRKEFYINDNLITFTEF